MVIPQYFAQVSDRLRAFKSAPASVRASVVLSTGQLLGFLVFGLLFGRQTPSILSTTSAPFLFVGLALGTLLFGLLFALPVGILLSRYPRRRHREAVVFQAVILFVFVDALVSRFSLTGAVITGATVAVIVLLVTPSTREFVSQRERRFATIA